MSDIFNDILEKAADKDAESFTLTPEQIREISYLFDELSRWRETGLARLSNPSNVLVDGLSYINEKIRIATESGKEVVRMDINRARSFVTSVEAIQDAINYSMLGGVPCPKNVTADFEITFPLDVSVVGDSTDTRYALAYIDNIKSAFAWAASSLGERGIWGLYPDSTALSKKVQSIRLSAKENQYDGVDGVAIVTIAKSLTGFDVASVIRFLVKQINVWLAAKVRSYTFEIDGEQCAVSMDDAKDVTAHSIAPIYKRDSDFHVLKERLFDPLSENMVDKGGNRVHSHVVTTVSAEVDSSPGEFVTVTDKINNERMSFAFDMNGKLR